MVMRGGKSYLRLIQVRFSPYQHAHGHNDWNIPLSVRLITSDLYLGLKGWPRLITSKGAIGTKFVTKWSYKVSGTLVYG